MENSVYIQPMKNKYLYSLFFSLCGLAKIAYATELSDINQLIRFAVQSHPLVGAAQAEQQATAEEVQAAKYNVFPTPSVQSGYDVINGMTSALRVRQPLWTGGKLKADINHAFYTDQAAMANIAEQRNMVAKNTINAWQSYIEAVGLQYLYTQTIQELIQFEQMMQRRVEQGVSARIELDLVNNRMLQMQNQYDAAIEQRRVAEARLEQIMGQRLENIDTLNQQNLQMMLVQAKQNSQQFESLVFSEQSQNHPAVVKAKYQTEAAKAQAISRASQRYPTVYAQYQYDYFHDSNKDNSQLSVGLAFEPGASFSNFAITRASQARISGLEQSSEATRRTINEEMQTQYQQLLSARSRAKALSSAVAGAKIVTDSYQRQFITGRKSWLDVLNAVREHSDYQAQLVQTEAALLAAYYTLQIDFAMMPWQHLKNNQSEEPSNPWLDFLKNVNKLH